MTKLIWVDLTHEQKIEHIGRLHRMGDSTSILADKLSEIFTTPINRNMIASIYSRQRDMREKYPLGGTRIAKTRIQKPKAPRKSRAKNPDIVKPVSVKPVVVKPVAITKRSWEANVADEVLRLRREYDANAKNIDLVDLNSSMCHFPVNDGGPFLYCGHDVHQGKEYCKHHYDRSFYRYKPVLKTAEPARRITKHLLKNY